MYQVTAIYQDAEIGYGEGESLSWAKAEARESISSFYASVLDQVKWIVIKSSI